MNYSIGNHSSTGDTYQPAKEPEIVVALAVLEKDVARLGEELAGLYARVDRAMRGAGPAVATPSGDVPACSPMRAQIDAIDSAVNKLIASCQEVKARLEI